MHSRPKILHWFRKSHSFLPRTLEKCSKMPFFTSKRYVFEAVKIEAGRVLDHNILTWKLLLRAQWYLGSPSVLCAKRFSDIGLVTYSPLNGFITILIRHDFCFILTILELFEDRSEAVWIFLFRITVRNKRNSRGFLNSCCENLNSLKDIISRVFFCTR